MPRPPGRRNRDYEQTRHALALAIAPHLLDPSGDPASLIALANAAGVSVPTIRHYFSDRSGVFRAALHAVLMQGAEHLDVLSQPGDRSAAECCTEMAFAMVVVWRRFGLGPLIIAAMSLGLANPVQGPVVLAELMEPLLQSAETGLRGLTAMNRLPELDHRAAALSLLGPILFALLHQDGLGGASERHLDLDAYTLWHARLISAGLSNSNDPAEHHTPIKETDMGMSAERR